MNRIDEFVEVEPMTSLPARHLYSALGAAAVMVGCGGQATREASARPVHALEPATQTDGNPSGRSEPSAPQVATQTPPSLSSEVNPTPSTLAAGYSALPVDGFENALVWDPGDETITRPVWVVAHGAGGNPEWHCEFWRRVVGSSAFLLCLRGKRMRPGAEEYYFPEHITLGHLVDAALAAFDARYLPRVNAKETGYIGYSQGANMGALMLPERSARLSRALLAEGGFSQWTSARARRFARNGGRGIFFACGTNACRTIAKKTLRLLQNNEVPTLLLEAPGAGHTPAGKVGEASIEGLHWLEGLPEN
jgi:hypothetical protein